jgi:hypothetical protein
MHTSYKSAQAHMRNHAYREQDNQQYQLYLNTEPPGQTVQYVMKTLDEAHNRLPQK